ncbi:MAG: DNA replication/repair protein RecF [Gammaproteobacteria bacterium]|nr:DNA replication/repair protein RecF [Gammaproteobacteria bacterium]
MVLEELRIENLRNIKTAILFPGKKFNLIYGPNGSGKTSLLEAIYLLSTAKSFRTSKSYKIINQEADLCNVFGIVTDSASQQKYRLGVQKAKKNTEVRIEGQKQQNVIQLAKNFPQIVITPNSHQLLEAGPQWRRKFFDWGVFHVKHSFGENWQHYNRALKQRNVLLHQGQQNTEWLRQIELWNDQLCQFAQSVTEDRKAYLELLKPYLAKYVTNFIQAGEVELEFKSGIPKGKTLAELLKNNIARDQSLGRTEYGPHRWDVSIKFNGREANQSVSRGQQKLIIYALSLAQLKVYAKGLESDATLLIDDLSAELDDEHTRLLIKALDQEFGQVFITTANLDTLPLEDMSEKEVFHVEHGEFNLVTTGR